MDVRSKYDRVVALGNLHGWDVFRHNPITGSEVLLSSLREIPPEPPRWNSLQFILLAASTLRHENLCRIGEILPSATSLWIVQDSPRCSRIEDLDSVTITLNTAITILTQVASALDYIHAQGLAHGRLSSSSISFDPIQSQVYVSDFPLAAAYSILGGSIADPRDDLRALGQLTLDV